MARENDGNQSNWRGGMLIVAAVFTAICVYQVTQIEAKGSGAIFGALLFGGCGLLAFLRARRRV